MSKVHHGGKMPGQSRYKSGTLFGILTVGAALKFAGGFETRLGENEELLVIDAAQFSVGEAKRLEIPDKSGHLGHLSVEPGMFCPLLSGQCPVLSQECPGFVRFCHPWKAGKQVRRFWLRKFSRSHFAPFCREYGRSGTLQGSSLPGNRIMIAGIHRSWKGASVRLCQNNHKRGCPG